MDKKIIEKNFSKCAPYYDRYADIQNICGEELVSNIKKYKFNRILEIGCGTGNYTKLLRKAFPYADIKAIDISERMVLEAQKKIPANCMEFIVADGEDINLKKKFDLITSNAAFQWFEDLDKALLKYRSLLRAKGIISFSLFGPRTYYELDRSLRAVFGDGTVISSREFTSKNRIEKFLKDRFIKVEIKEVIYREKSLSLVRLFRKIKYTGVRGAIFEKRKIWTPRILKRLEDVYKEKFNAIDVTYDLIFCTVIR